MTTRLLFLIGLTFLIISFTFFAVALSLPQHSSSVVPVSSFQRGAGSGGGPGGPSGLADTPVNNLLIDKYWPSRVDINNSDHIKVILTTATTGPAFATTATTGTYRVAEETPQPYGVVGTPETSGQPTTVRQMFGLTAEPFAIAHLVTTTFDVKPSGPEEKPLAFAGGQVEWDWNIAPKTLGVQVIDANMELLWKNKSNGQVIQELPIWESQFTIMVIQPFLDTSQLTIGALASAALGSGGILTSIIIWLLDQIGKRWESRKKQTEKSAHPSSDQSSIAVPSPLPSTPSPPIEKATSPSSPASGTLIDASTNALHQGGGQTSSSATSPTFSHRAAQPHRGLTVNMSIVLVPLSLCALLIVLIVGASALVNYATASRSARIKAQHAQATASAQSLATANAQATSFALSTLPQGIYSRATSNSPALADPLSAQGRSAWHNYSGTSGSCLFIGGTYHINVLRKASPLYCPATLQILNNFAFQVQMTFIKNGYGAIGFQAVLPPDSVNSKLYVLFIRQDGVYYFIEGKHLVGSGNSLPMMHAGLHQENVITMITHGGTLYLFINRVIIISVSHVDYQYGRIFLGGFAENEPVNVAFSNAQVWIF